MHETVVFCTHNLKIQPIDALTLRGHGASWVTSSKEAGLEEQAFLAAANRKRHTAGTAVEQVSVSWLSARRAQSSRAVLTAERCPGWARAPGEEGAELSQCTQTQLQGTPCYIHIASKILLHNVCVSMNLVLCLCFHFFRLSSNDRAANEVVDFPSPKVFKAKLDGALTLLVKGKVCLSKSQDLELDHL